MKKRAGFNTSMGLTLFLLLVLVMVLFMADGKSFSSQETLILEQWEVLPGSEVIMEDGNPRSKNNRNWIPINKPMLKNNSVDHIYWFRTKVPEFSGAYPSVFIPIVIEQYQVYFQGQMLHQSGRMKATNIYNATGNRWKILSLEKQSGRDYLYLKVYSEFAFSGFLGEFHIGPIWEHIPRIIKKDIVRLSLGVLYLFIFAISIIFFLYRKIDKSFFAFSFFTLSMAIYTFFYTDVKQIFLDLPGLWIFLWILSLFLMPMWIALFLEPVFDSKWKKIIRRIWQIHLGYCLLSMAIIISGATNGLYLRFPFFIMESVSSFIMVYAVFKKVLAGNQEARIFLMGMGMLVVFAMFDVGLALSGLVVNVLPLGHIGMAMLILSMAMILVSRYIHTYQNLENYNMELNVAHKIQQSTIPGKLPSINGIQMAARFIPMEAVGGDLYDYHIPDNKKIGILIADVAGHGIPAALIASMVKITFHILAEVADKPSSLLSRMNQILTNNVENHFITAAYGWLDVEAGILEYSNAGHPPILLHRKTNDQIMDLTAKGRMIGFAQSASYENGRVEIIHGDRLIFFTDGVEETRGSSGTQFGDQEFHKVLRSGKDKNAEEFAQFLTSRLRQWAGKNAVTEDDITFLIVDID